MASNKTVSQHASLSGSDDSSVKRILTHIDRLLAFSKVEWFLHEQRKDTILKLDFIQDRKYTNVFQMSDSLPRVNDHISRLTQSHKLKEWSLREREGCASIIIAFQYDNSQSDETLFFLNTEHLKLVNGLNEHKDSHKGQFSDTLSAECQCKCNPGTSENKNGRILTETYSTPLVSTRQPPSHCAPGRGRVQSQSETDTLLLTPSEITSAKERPTSVNRPDVRESQLPRRENKTSSKTPAPKPHQSTVATSTTKRRDAKSESENTSKSFKNKFPSVIRKNAAKKPTNTKNPFSVTGVSANPNNANRKSKFIHTGNSRRPLQKSKSVSVITRPSDTTPGNGRNISASSQAENERTASKFTFSKEYRKLKPESKPPAVNLSNPSVKRKHERSDHFTDTEDHISDSLKPGQQGMLTTESTSSDKVGPKEVVLTSSNHPQNTVHGKGIYPACFGEHGSPIGDLYRLYFADSADISMYNNDVFWSSTDRTHNSKSSSQMADMPHCSTPSVKPPSGHAGVFGELTKKFFAHTAETASDSKAAKDFWKCQYNTSQTHSGATSPRKSGTEPLSEAESSIDNDSQQDTTITEASQTDCDMFSCCTEPCLDESVKEEIQEYFVKIYNQVQSEPRVETVQLVWQINEEGRICLYHKYLNQAKKHDLVSPEELQDLEKNGSHSVVPRSIRQQYIFRRLLDELDQVTFDNRPLTDAEKRRLDNFMTSEAGCT